MNILITGAAGYLGSQMCLDFSVLGDNVVGIDNLLFNQGPLVNTALQDTVFINCDVDDIPEMLIESCDVCLPMACLVGMPIVKQNPNMATRVNKNSILKLLSKLKPECKVIIPSTNSGYGTSTDICTEETPLNSVSLYGKLKEELEQEAIKRDNTVIFRLATVFGMSPRPRFDLLVNTLVYQAYFDNKIEIFDNGFMRNYVHVCDIVDAFRFCLENWDKMKNNIYNLGDDSLNCTKGELAEKIRTHTNMPDIPIQFIEGSDPDQRNYRVSSEKLYQTGFSPLFGFEYGIKEIYDYCKTLPQDKEVREQLVKLMRNDQFIAKNDY